MTLVVPLSLLVFVIALWAVSQRRQFWRRRLPGERPRNE
jgi:hypothetical protein